MTARPGDAIHLDLDGTVIAGRYIEVDPPHRLVIGWDRQGTDTATPTPAFIEITFTPAGDGTDVEVQLSGLSAEDDAFYGELWERHLYRIAAAFAGADPAHFLATESWTSPPTPIHGYARSTPCNRPATE
jgi:uncharacterized protein YndB with AHSA1/START domain